MIWRLPWAATPGVALLAEGVDRNAQDDVDLVGLRVALLAEGVDRNCTQISGAPLPDASPSSQRAWIEIARLRR